MLRRAKISPSSPNPFSHEGRRGAKIRFKVFLFPSPSMGEGLGVRVLKTSA